jgi:hypothetical protein
MSDRIELENIILEEGKDYDLIPLEEHEDAWGIRILEGIYTETVLKFGAIGFNEKKDALTFNFDIVSSPNSELDVKDVELQTYAGLLLQSVISSGIEDGTVELQEVDE